MPQEPSSSTAAARSQAAAVCWSRAGHSGGLSIERDTRGTYEGLTRSFDAYCYMRSRARRASTRQLQSAIVSSDTRGPSDITEPQNSVSSTDEHSGVQTIEAGLRRAAMVEARSRRKAVQIALQSSERSSSLPSPLSSGASRPMRALPWLPLPLSSRRAAKTGAARSLALAGHLSLGEARRRRAPVAPPR